MTRSGAMLLALLLAFVCRHPNDVEQEAHAVTAPQPAASPGPQLPPPTVDRGARRADEVRRPANRGPRKLASDPLHLMKPDAPKRLQRRLAALGYYSESETASFDAQTADALRRFQELEGLAGTGTPDEATLKALGFDPDEIWR